MFSKSNESHIYIITLTPEFQCFTDIFVACGMRCNRLFSNFINSVRVHQSFTSVLRIVAHLPLRRMSIYKLGLDLSPVFYRLVLKYTWVHFLLANTSGRKDLKIQWPSSWSWLAKAAILGVSPLTTKVKLSSIIQFLFLIFSFVTKPIQLRVI